MALGIFPWVKFKQPKVRVQVPEWNLEVISTALHQQAQGEKNKKENTSSTLNSKPGGLKLHFAV